MRIVGRRFSLQRTGLAAADDRPILDADVQVQVTAVADQQQVLSTPATTEASVNKLFYETDFVIDEVGEYQVSVIVAGPDGSGNATFPMTVAPARPMNWLAIGLAALVLVVAATLYRHRVTDSVGEA